MKLTSIRIYPNNSPENRVIKEMMDIEGGDDLLRKMFFTYFKSLDRLKISYIFKEEYKGEINFRYNLTKEELVNAEKFIPNFKR